MAPSAVHAEQVWEEHPRRSQSKQPLNANSTSGNIMSTLPEWSVQSDTGSGSTNAGACCGIAAGRTTEGQEQLVAPWVDWVEGGIEFFGCDGRSRKDILGRTLTLSHRMAGTTSQHSSQSSTAPVDHAQLHDNFIEGLFQEQWSKRMDSNTNSALIIRDKDDDDDDSSVPLNRVESAGTEPSHATSNGSWDSSSVSSAPMPTTPHSKRRIPLKFKKATTGKIHSRVAPLDAYQRQYGSKPPVSSSSKPRLPPRPPTATFEMASLPQAAPAADMAKLVEEMVHSECKIQKDKGKGEPVGTSISADGRANCLSKLREKIRLLVQVALDGPSSLASDSSSESNPKPAPSRRKGKRGVGAAAMKRRPAKVSEENPLYTETRSMIELRLGFVSMQYGLLLRWDRTQKIVFVVLRKMCHDSFYKKIKAPVRGNSSTGGSAASENGPQHDTPDANKAMEPPPLVVRNMVGEQAIYQRIHGTEVVLVDVPYRIPQPQAFEPSILSVQVKQVEGLTQRQRWTIALTFDGHTEVTELMWKQGRFVPRRVETMEWEIAPMTSFDLAGLEIRIFEQVSVLKRRKVKGKSAQSKLKSRFGATLKSSNRTNSNVIDPKDKENRWLSSSRVFSNLTMPLGGLVAQPSTAQATSWELTIPANDNVSITMSLVHQSDYAHWLYKELDARRQEEVTTYVRRKPFRRTRVRDVNEDCDEDYDDMWDWLCGFCTGDDSEEPMEHAQRPLQ